MPPLEKKIKKKDLRQLLIAEELIVSDKIKEDRRLLQVRQDALCLRRRFAGGGDRVMP